MVTLRHIQLRNCSGWEEVQFFRKAAGVTLVLEDVVQVGGKGEGVTSDVGAGAVT
jgi:hypothetical protein